MKKTAIIFLFSFFCVSSSFAQYTKLHDFDSISGKQPMFGSLLLNGSFLYGVTQYGGVNNKGVIFAIRPDGTGYSKLYDFDSINGFRPMGSLVSDGVFLYGMTTYGGTNNSGTIFKIAFNGSGYSVLHHFGSINDGGFGQGSLIYDGSFLYGMTVSGGLYGFGSIFKIKSDGTGYSILFNFDEVSGSNPMGSLIFDGSFLYGMTYMGGSNLSTCGAGCGVIFKIKPDGTSFSVLLDFGSTNANKPYGSLISDGTFLYGMTSNDDTDLNGVVFRLKPDGAQYQEICSMLYNTTGRNPAGSLYTDGSYLYGMAAFGGTIPGSQGTLFEIKKDGHNPKQLINFLGVNGAWPNGSLISDGIYLYGMTTEGGQNNKGIIFKNCLARYKTSYDSTQNIFTLNVDSSVTASAVNYEWDFGDGSFSSLATPTHLYSQDSIYNVCMKIYLASGDSCNYCNLIGKDSLGETVRNEGFTLNVVNTDSPTNIPQIFSSDILISLYPNPSNGNITLSYDLEENENAIITLYDVTGKLLDKVILNPNLTSMSLNKTYFKAGLYYYCISVNGKKVKTEKLVIIK
jgi:uncharacterized repeat protein (TIGR03803 family)